MKVINEVVPSDQNQIAQMAEPGPEGPVFMVNLLKFKEKAEYADGRETDLTGRDAYQIYGAGVSDLIPKLAARSFLRLMSPFFPSARSKTCGTKWR